MLARDLAQDLEIVTQAGTFEGRQAQGGVPGGVGHSQADATASVIEGQYPFQDRDFLVGHGAIIGGRIER